ncbi:MULTISPECIES: hypothetical protein [unclassified Micromonospora]|uniref:hypothetical protein n=1 Tax=unclassified Micromonospora TaxID=2617518 RepID=UPI001C228B7D|nr:MULTISPECIES: hypothetical protein [unclassified Micromonospora]MBU8857711.1 hypothetical protein [Micromonospora sp. WMMB482]MDM4783338.1 hypothetical protein [Micromonospora sp. b486]
MIGADDDLDPAARSAAQRIAFQLTYARADIPRRFEPGELSGPDIPCAYGSVLAQSGGWEVPEDCGAPGRTEAEWVDRFASYAVAEATHEALEWFRVDGRPWLDPHGRAAKQIHAAVDELCDKLAEVRRTLLMEPNRREEHACADSVTTRCAIGMPTSSPSSSTR